MEIRNRGDTIHSPGSWHQITGGPVGVRFLCCCFPPCTDEDTYFES